MSRIKGLMSAEEFENVCNNKGIYTKIEILNRYGNYLITYKGFNDGRTANEVGASVIEEDLYE